jgi:hypothetical protein
LGVQVWKKTTPFPSLSKNTLGDLRCGQQLPSRMLRDGKGQGMARDGELCDLMDLFAGSWKITVDSWSGDILLSVPGATLS